MKKIITLLPIIFICLAAGAQTVKQQAVVVGGSKISPDVKDGLFAAYLAAGTNQVALVAGLPFTSTYYAIYTPDNRLLHVGKFVKRGAGEYDVIDLGRRLDNFRIVFSKNPVIVHASIRVL